MLQRIQTLYLLLSVILMGVCAGQLFGRELDAWAFWTALASCALTVVLAIFTIFDYRNRRRQMRMCVRLMLLCVIAGACLWQNLLLLTFPVVSLVSVMLARMRVKHDDDLVRAADRIR